ncbi:MAG: glycosyl hydrolase family 18 protein [Proteobacteria bacterium]|nr:glycosyl hydrolase family 18 protein [Pseudomonadota bacterium]
MRKKLLSASVLTLLIASTTYLNAYSQLVNQKGMLTTASAKSVGVNSFDHVVANNGVVKIMPQVTNGFGDNQKLTYKLQDKGGVLKSQGVLAIGQTATITNLEIGAKGSSYQLEISPQSVKDHSGVHRLIGTYTKNIELTVTSPEADVSLLYKNTNDTDRHIMLGYFMPLIPSINYYELAAEHGYNVAINAFVKIQCETDSSCVLTDQYGQQAVDIAHKVDVAKEKYPQFKYAMLSVTWQGLDNFNVGSASADHIKLLAKTIVDYLNQAHLDGIDFDLEAALSLKHWDGNALDQLIKQIRTDKPNVIVTAAPQLFKNIDGKYILVTQGLNQDYDVAIENGDFDYVVIQEALSLPEEANPNIISESIKQLEGTDSAVKIPVKTKLLPDVLSGPNVNPSNPNSVWHACTNSKAPDCTTVFKALAEQYQSLIDNPQFGGAATWSINQDQSNTAAKSNPWQWATTIGNVI